MKTRFGVILCSLVLLTGMPASASEPIPDLWEDPGQIPVILTAAVTLDGKIPEDAAFGFRLLDGQGTPVYEAENQGCAVAFPVLRFDTPGVYRYYLKEIQGPGEETVHDRAVYTAIVDVRGEHGLTVSLAWERNGKAYAGIPEFRNYTQSAAPQTGDSVITYGSVLLLSGIGLAGSAVFGIKKRSR